MLEVAEPKPVCEVRVGQFTYLSHTGDLVTDDFCVNTCTDENPTKRVNDYNEQLTDEWENLIDKGCSNIRFIEATPNPIF